MTNTTPPTQILIIGGGFGGIRAAIKLSRRPGYEVTLISNLDTFAYYPLFYHAATGGSWSKSALPLSQVLAGTKVKFIQDVIVAINPDARTLTSIDNHTIYHYDELIMALGSITNYFGIKGVKELSYDIRSVQGVNRLKSRLAEKLSEGQLADHNYVVVGGGPTGIELAASLKTHLTRLAAQHQLKDANFEVQLVEAMPRLLPRSAEAVSALVQHRLESMGVKVITGIAVKAQTAEGLELADRTIPTGTVIWTAGVATNPFYYSNGAYFQLARNGRVMVSEHLEARDHVYIIGDNADTKYAGMAQTALHDADYVAQDIVRVRTGQPRPAYRPKLPIGVIPIGEYWAVAEWGKLHIAGFIASFLRRAADLIGYADVMPWRRALRLWLQKPPAEDEPLANPDAKG